MSAVTVQVPLASAGTAFVKVYVVLPVAGSNVDFPFAVSLKYGFPEVAGEPANFGENDVSLLPSTGVPSPFVILKTAVGFLPGTRSVTLTIVALRPLSCLAFSGTVCAALIEASQSAPLSAVWHLVQALSGCAPPAWFAPVVKSTSSWQEPHAAALGCVK